MRVCAAGSLCPSPVPNRSATPGEGGVFASRFGSGMQSAAPQAEPQLGGVGADRGWAGDT